MPAIHNHFENVLRWPSTRRVPSISFLDILETFRVVLILVAGTKQ
jgi:hypothetical protein